MREAQLGQAGERAGHQRPANAPAPRGRVHEEAAHLAHVVLGVQVAVGPEPGVAEQLPVLVRNKDAHPLLGEQSPEALGLEAREAVAGGQQVGEALARGSVPDLADRLAVGDPRRPDQRAPPAIAGRITIVSLSDTPVSSPSSTRTSSSLR